MVENHGCTQTCPCYDDDADDDDDDDDDDGDDDDDDDDDGDDDDGGDNDDDDDDGDCDGDGDGEDFATPGTLFSNKPIHLHTISMGVLTFSLDEGTTHYYESFIKRDHSGANYMFFFNVCSKSDTKSIRTSRLWSGGVARLSWRISGRRPWRMIQCCYYIYTYKIIINQY